jgi:hypothetical protein
VQRSWSMADASNEPLFDDFERTNDDPPLFSEGAYSYLNRAAGARWSKARALLEDWFAHYPDDHKVDLRKRFTFSDEGQHIGAWWELYIYSLYRHLGYSIEVHSEIAGISTRPDFLVAGDAGPMYIECTVDSVSDRPVTTNPGIEAAIYDAINKIKKRNFFVGLEFKQEGKQQPSRKQIVRDVGNWLEGLNPDDVLADLEAARATGDLATLPEKDFCFHDWIVTCTAYPNDPGKRHEGGRLLGALPSGGAFFVRNIQRIREAVRRKGARYGAVGVLDKPLVVALLSISSFAEWSDVTDAMFGSTAIRYVEGDPESTKPIRQQNGNWRGPDSERGVRVSAVLFSHDMQPWSVASHLPAAWINPWADKPINGHPPLTVFTASNEGLVSEKPSDVTPQDVFGPQIT